MLIKRFTPHFMWKGIEWGGKPGWSLPTLAHTCSPSSYNQHFDRHKTSIHSYETSDCWLQHVSIDTSCNVRISQAPSSSSTESSTREADATMWSNSGLKGERVGHTNEGSSSVCVCVCLPLSFPPVLSTVESIPPPLESFTCSAAQYTTSPFQPPGWLLCVNNSHSLLLNVEKGWGVWGPYP